MKYIICGSYINAWDIERGLKKLGHNVLYAASENPLHHEFSFKKEGYLFFTDEYELKQALSFYKESYFYPKKIEFLIDDKFEFYNFLKSIDELPVAYSKPIDLNNNFFSYPYVIKANSSWQEDEKVKIPRGRVCFKGEDHKQFLKEMREKNFKESNYFTQEYLPDGILNNFSTCGFFDYTNPKKSISIITRKILATEHGFDSSGMAVITVKDPQNLKERTFKILSKLSFKGPFELEFLYDEKTNTFKVLEFNPRFWMQHGIFIDHYNNALLKSYLNYNINENFDTFKKIIWLDTIALLMGFILFNKKIIFFYFFKLPFYLIKGYKTNFSPSFFKASSFVLRKAKNKIIKMCKKWFLI